MPTVIIIICTILSTGLLLASYMARFAGLRRKTYQINPLSPTSWIANSIISIIFLMASRNLVLVGISVSALVLQIILLVWSIYDVRHSDRHEWRIKPEDFICVGLAVIALGMYRLTSDVTLGAAIAFAGQIFGEIPQLRKDYFSPKTDKIQIYLIVALRYTVMTGTLQQINFVGLSQTFFWAVVSLLEVGWIIYCQNRQVWQVRRAVKYAINFCSIDERSRRAR